LFSVICPGIIEDKATYDDFRAKPNTKQTNFLERLANCKVHAITGSSVNVIDTEDKWGVGMLGLSPDLLFVRDFYPDLLKEIRKSRRCVLIGNPGIGKSYFQFYYLARIMNPSLFGPLPPDCFGSTEPPRFVIRQEGTRRMTIYDVVNRRAERVEGNRGTLLDCFDPETSLYLMEPAESRIEPHFASLYLPTLATVSPDSSRYKEFCKNSGKAVYMPTFTLKELQAIGKYQLDEGKVPQELKEEYSPEQITERFRRYGGIIRHVLPESIYYSKTCIENQKKAIKSCDAHALLVSQDLEDHDVSHFIMQYSVKWVNTERPFWDISLDFVSDDIASKMDEKICNSNLKDKMLALVRNDEVPTFMEKSSPELYEQVVAEHLTSRRGVNWLVEAVQRKADVNWTPFHLKLKELAKGKVPLFADMTPLVLYQPLKTNYPFFDFMYKTEEVVGIANMSARYGVSG
jgi:hypothetical protein